MACRSRGAHELRRWREESELTQADAAQKAGIDPWYYAKIERGARKPGRQVSVALQTASNGRVLVAMWDETDPSAAA